jgi:hypothetical protein
LRTIHKKERFAAIENSWITYRLRGIPYQESGLKKPNHRDTNLASKTKDEGENRRITKPDCCDRQHANRRPKVGQENMRATCVKRKKNDNREILYRSEKYC